MRGDYIPPQSAVPVRIVLTGGSALAGKLFMRTTKSFAEALNAPHAFVEFESYSGERCHLAKAQVVSITLDEAPKTPNLATAPHSDDFDPRRILGVNADASQETIRQAYLRTAKKYHPDRYAGVELPDEVFTYFGAMVRSINAAYAALQVKV